MSESDPIERLAAEVVDCGYHLHLDLGPGLLETAYEMLMFELLRQRGFEVARQVPVPIVYRKVRIENAFRIDLLIENALLVELKSVEKLAPIHSKQLLTYLRLVNKPLGILMNFGQPMFKDGVRRVANGYLGPFIRH